MWKRVQIVRHHDEDGQGGGLEWDGDGYSGYYGL